METYVFVAVLIGAACHASWNAVIKFGLEPFTTTALIAIMSGLVARRWCRCSACRLPPPGRG